MSTAETVKFTYEDYLLIPEDGKRHEIIDGEEYVTVAPRTPHQRVVVNLLYHLHRHVGKHDAGEVFVAPTDVIFSETEVVQPDVLYVAAERAAIVEEHGITDAPDLIAEIVSEGNRRHDEIRKRKLYAKHGVREYWVVDPELETVKVYRPADGDYKRVAELTAEGDDVLNTPLLDGFVLPLRELFG